MRSHGEAWNVFCQYRRAGVKGCEVSPKMELIQAFLVNDDRRWLIQERYLAKPTPTLLLALHNSWQKLPEPGWKFLKWGYSLIVPELTDVGWSSKWPWACLPPSLYQQSTASLPVWVSTCVSMNMVASSRDKRFAVSLTDSVDRDLVHICTIHCSAMQEMSSPRVGCCLSTRPICLSPAEAPGGKACSPRSTAQPPLVPVGSSVWPNISWEAKSSLDSSKLRVG